MHIDPGTPEAVFAKKLASCEPKIRRKALNRLRTWIAERVKSERYFDETDLLKLWKGLYYCMWMQDKPLLQEELGQSVSELINCFGNSEQKFLYMDTFLKTVSREWGGIDRWRMDKFMLFVRIFIRQWLCWLKQQQWKKKFVSKTLSVWKKTVLSPCDSSCPAGLKYHFASVYLDEIDNAGKSDLDPKQVNVFLAPYLELLAKKTLSDTFFDTILNEIFETILLNYTNELELDEQERSAGIKFDYETIASQLFAVGKSPETAGNRRRKIYEFVRKFRLAAKEQDPFEIIESDIGSDLDDTELESAAKRYIRRKEVDKKEKKRIKKDIRKRTFISSDISGEEDSHDEESRATQKKKRRKRKQD